MMFYSTNNPSLRVSLKEAVLQGLAPDNGLYMPERIPSLPDTFFQSISTRTFQENSFIVVNTLLGDSVPPEKLRAIVDHTIQFDAPLVNLEQNIFALELFHGPTLAFKDFGARFMSKMLSYFAEGQDRDVVVLVATSGDTGSAVANGFLDIDGVRVVVLYPSGKVSDIQEKQFTTLGKNITAVEVDGTFDDCQGMVKQAFLDRELKEKFFLTSANSINIARLIPQSFYYFHAYAQLEDKSRPLVFSVPSGNFGNLTAGLLAMRMGLPVERFIASTNVNDVVPEYLATSIFTPRSSTATLSNAMDVGNPSNFYRMLDLYNGSYADLTKILRGYRFTDQETRDAMQSVNQRTGYTLDPHGAVAFLGLKEYLGKRDDATGIFLETAHPAKFKESVEEILQKPLSMPPALDRFLQGTKKATPLSGDFHLFKTFLLDSF